MSNIKNSIPFQQSGHLPIWKLPTQTVPLRCWLYDNVNVEKSYLLSITTGVELVPCDLFPCVTQALAKLNLRARSRSLLILLLTTMYWVQYNVLVSRVVTPCVSSLIPRNLSLLRNSSYSRNTPLHWLPASIIKVVEIQYLKTEYPSLRTYGLRFNEFFVHFLGWLDMPYEF